MKQVIIFPRGQLKEIDKARLMQIDIVVIEADNPKDVVCVIPSATLISPDDLLIAALTGIEKTGQGGQTMALELLRRLRKKEDTQ